MTHNVRQNAYPEALVRGRDANLSAIMVSGVESLAGSVAFAGALCFSSLDSSIFCGIRLESWFLR
jgi:hypothetical protein